MIKFLMPSLGADMEDGTLREWNVKVGDTVKRGDIIAVVETQKGLIEIEIFEEGKIEELLVKENEKVPVGSVMALLSSDKKEEKEIQGQRPEKIKTENIISIREAKKIKASPLAKRIAEENKIDLTGIKGTGEGGAITKEDVEGFIQSKSREILSPTGSIRRAVAAAMSKSKREIPHYYLEARIDMSKALAWVAEANKQRSVENRLLPVVLLIKATAMALKEVPDLNAWWINKLQPKSDVNIGFVVSLRAGGIIVPAIHDADKKTPDELMKALSDIIPRARSLKLKSSELSDSTITLTNLGDNGAETVYGIIYPPQVALVGFGSIAEQAWVENGTLTVRPVVIATLSADHRATDGITGSKFLQALKNYLQHPEQL